jgi:hypothetical protein
VNRYEMEVCPHKSGQKKKEDQKFEDLY